MDSLLDLPKPRVSFFGAAANTTETSAHKFASINQLIDVGLHYAVVLKLPRVKCCDSGDIRLSLTKEGQVIITGEITPTEIFAASSVGRKTKRTQLCPTEPWGISFRLPGPVDTLSPVVEFSSLHAIEITVMKSTSRR